jgi:hypothetical protein
MDFTGVSANFEINHRFPQIMADSKQILDTSNKPSVFSAAALCADYR